MHLRRVPFDVVEFAPAVAPHSVQEIVAVADNAYGLIGVVRGSGMFGE